MNDELTSQLALELIPGLGPKGVKQLVSYCGSTADVFKAPKGQLRKIPGVGEKLAEIIRTHRPFKEAQKILDDAHKIDVNILHYTNREYPQRLKQIPDAPNILFTKGSGQLNPKKSIAVIGTRKATPYGKEVCEQIVRDLSNLEVTVVSGLAYGIDICAHKKALQQNTPTFAVLAGGLDKIYPSVHKKFAQDMLANGGIISERIPGTKPDAPLFPARNRIIAGMSDAVIVVEAAEKGGALITAHQADSYDRPVFAVPGNIGSEFSKGTNRLLATQKALIYTGIEDLIYQLGWDIAQKRKELEINPDLNQEEQTIYDLLQAKNQAQEIDLIAIHTQLSINQVAATLLSLEFKNLVKSLPGKKFTLT